MAGHCWEWLWLPGQSRWEEARVEVGCWCPAAPCQQGAREESEQRDWLPWPPLWRWVQPVSGIGEEGPLLEGLGEKNMQSMEPRGQQYLRNSVGESKRAGWG